jgi:hypothetical protein
LTVRSTYIGLSLCSIKLPFMYVASQQGKTAVIRILRTEDGIGLVKVHEFAFGTTIAGLDTNSCDEFTILNTLTTDGLQAHMLQKYR